jgi:hypothetical protein
LWLRLSPHPMCPRHWHHQNHHFPELMCQAHYFHCACFRLTTLLQKGATGSGRVHDHKRRRSLQKNSAMLRFFTNTFSSTENKNWARTKQTEENMNMNDWTCMKHMFLQNTKNFMLSVKNPELNYQPSFAHKDSDRI